MDRWFVVACAALSVTLCAAPRAAADPTGPTQFLRSSDLYQALKLSIGYHFSSGHYGTSDTTQISYVPLVIRAELGRLTLRGTIPYLSITGPPGVIIGPGGAPIPGKADGLGDIFFATGYLLPRPYTWPAWVPFTEIVGLVKFPTASRSDGLGTGEFDFGVAGDLTWAFGRLTPFATIGYRFLGNPPGVLPENELSNVLGASVGGQYQIFTTLSAGLSLDYRQAASAETGEQLELVPFASWKFIRPWSLDVYALAGLKSGSPDAGFGLQVGYTW